MADGGHQLRVVCVTGSLEAFIQFLNARTQIRKIRRKERDQGRLERDFFRVCQRPSIGSPTTGPYDFR